MSRRKRKKRGNPPQQPQTRSAKQPVNPKEAEIKTASDEAVAAAREEDLSSISNDPKPEGSSLDSLWEIVREARDVFRSAAKRNSDEADQAEEARRQHEERSSELDEREVQQASRSTELQGLEANLTSRAGALDEREADLARREVSLTEEEAKIRQREINAEAGFLAERKAMLVDLDDALGGLRASLVEAEGEIAEKRKGWHQEELDARRRLQEELDAERETQEANLTQREGELDAREEQLGADRQNLESARRRLDFDEQDLKEFRADLDKRVEQRAAAVAEELEHRIQAMTDQLEQARKDRDTHEGLLRQREEADRKFGQRTPEQVLEAFDALRAETDRLRATLAERPDADAAARLEKLERDEESWQAERSDLRRQNSELKRRVAYFDADTNEREVQRDVLRSLESQRQLLFEAHRQIRSEIDDLLSRNEAQSPFPACMEMDANPDLQSPGPMLDGSIDLKDFVEDLQHRIAFDVDHPEQRLYYTLPDLRSFLGGLAMSRLILLQGISGTGKTSLPVAFARAVGNPATVVEVQAGWRDPQDLVGHYNVFEKRFYEKEFLKALYRARTPRWQDAIHIVLLDEMNLSHPEQYFSDLLSALELQPQDRRLILMPHAIEQAPALFAEGSKLQIPTNVWFFGTANHDETTKDFADKTYDRAHVMEFPHRPQPFEIAKPEPRPPVSVHTLTKACDAAITRRQKSADKAIEFLESEVRDPLAHYFEIGWGPRLDRQMRRYVPVVVAAGGTIGEATDHLLAMRLLRKLKNRHDNRREHLEALRQRIEESWPGLDKKSSPIRSMKVLASELRRAGQAPEGEA